MGETYFHRFRNFVLSPDERGLGKAYAIYLDGVLRGDLVLDIPAGSHEATWIDMAIGESVHQERQVHEVGRLPLDEPSYRQDISLRVGVAEP